MTTSAAEPAGAPSGRVWARRRPINYQRSAEMYGGVASPLLAGFSLTSIVMLLTVDRVPWLSGWAICAFSGAAALFLYSLQFSAVSIGYGASPSERLELNPEAAVDAHILQTVLNRQWEETALRAKYQTRARYCYNFGMLGFLAGFGLLLVQHDLSKAGNARLAALAIIGLALLLELFWIVSNGKRPRFVLPNQAESPPSRSIITEAANDASAARYLFEDSVTLAKNLERCAQALERMSPRPPG